MIYDEPESMKEIRRIREKQYEETRDMSPEEQMEYFRKKADGVCDVYGLNKKTESKPV
jgi:hypothetical protein